VHSMNGSSLATVPRPADLPAVGGEAQASAAARAAAGRPPWLLTGLAALVCAALVLPVAFLIWQATGVGWPLISRLLCAG
jgi:hypothetical protein